MNSDSIKGNWEEQKGKVKQQWSRLSDSDMDQIDGQTEQLIEKIQQVYGKSREEAEREVRVYLK